MKRYAQELSALDGNGMCALINLILWTLLLVALLLSGCRSIWGTTDSDWKYHSVGEWPVGTVLQSGVTP